MVTLRLSPVRITYIMVGVFLLAVSNNIQLQEIYSNVYAAVDNFGFIGSVEQYPSWVIFSAGVAGVLKGIEYFVYYMIILVVVSVTFSGLKDGEISYKIHKLSSLKLFVYEYGEGTPVEDYDARLLFATFPAFFLFSLIGMLSNYMTLMFIILVVAFAVRTLLALIYFPAVPASQTQVVSAGGQGTNPGGTGGINTSTSISKATRVFKRRDPSDSPRCANCGHEPERSGAEYCPECGTEV